MRDHNHRICCYLNCSVSCWKNAHRCRARYLKRATTKRPGKRCTATDSVLVADGSRCDRRGMIALKVTLCRWRRMKKKLLFAASQSDVLSTNGNDADVCRRWRRNANSSGGGKIIDFLLRFFLLSCEASSSFWLSR